MIGAAAQNKPSGKTRSKKNYLDRDVSCQLDNFSNDRGLLKEENGAVYTEGENEEEETWGNDEADISKFGDPNLGEPAQQDYVCMRNDADEANSSNSQRSGSSGPAISNPPSEKRINVNNFEGYSRLKDYDHYRGTSKGGGAYVFGSLKQPTDNTRTGSY